MLLLLLLLYRVLLSSNPSLYHYKLDAHSCQDALKNIFHLTLRQFISAPCVAVHEKQLPTKYFAVKAVHFQAHPESCEERLLAASCLSVRPYIRLSLSVRMVQLCCHRTDIHVFFDSFSETCPENSRWIKI